MRDTIFAGHRVTAAPVVRSMSTLKQNPEFALPKGSNSKGFLYFFNNMTKSPRPLWTMISLVASAYIPPGTKLGGVTKETRKNFQRPVTKSFQEAWKESGMTEAINVKKNASDKTFTVLVPILSISTKSSYTDVLQLLGFDLNEAMKKGDPTPELPAELNDEVEISSIKPIGALTQRDIVAWSECDARLISRTVGSTVLFFIRYTVSQVQAQFLTNEKFELIKPMDLFGPVFEWVSTYYGQSGKSPSFSIPVRQIARAVDKASKEFPVMPRTNENGLFLDEHADLYWIPNELNEVNRFEDVYSDAYTHDSGTFGVIDLLEGNIKAERKKPPVPMPVYVDWLNMKFAYTNSMGRLNILNLDRTYPANATHITRWFDRALVSDRAELFLNTTMALASFYNVHESMTGANLIKAVTEYAREQEGSEPQDVKLVDVAIYATSAFGTPLEEAVKFKRVCANLISKVEQSPETAYARYSVLGVMNIIAGATLFNKYTKDVTKMADMDKSLRRHYLTQGVDKNYQIPAVPYVSDGIGVLPHQNKVLNLTREAPDNVLMAVAAGGGKTMIILIDLLRELKSGNKGPFLIACPAHLVAQYVKEIVYATGGRVNAVPVTSYTVRRHGFERLGTMIKAAPVNTVIITDYNVITLKQRIVAYGTTSVKIFPVIEFIRQFNPKVFYSDETHMLKSESNRQSAVHRLIADIPKKRGASGTFVQDTIRDLVKQASLFDPSIFGTPDDFVKEFALEVRGSKVLEWMPGTEALVKQRLRENFIYAEAQRKEWAAILPKPVESFNKVDMTPRQYEVYNQILNQVVEAIREEMEKNQALKDLLNTEAGTEGEEQDENFSIDQLLKPYLARLERFITAPGKDVLGATALTGDDLLSPKTRKIVEIAMDHVNKGVAGKVLIFTNYTLSAEAIFEAFPEDFRSKVIFYTADRKEECGAEFEKNPDKMVMVGVEQSMNTGLNLQFASRLIRCETVWTPGVLEQGNARIGRPNIKNAETRSEIFFDWIISNRTIDVTKISYLMSKTVSRAKFEEAGNPRFDELEVPPLFPMTLDTILESNDFDTTMLDYYEKYKAYKEATFDEYANYRDKFKDILFDANGKIRMTPIRRSENLEGSKLILRVPYVPGTELYKASELGLIRYDEFMRQSEAEDTGDEEEDDSEDTDEEITDGDDSISKERELAIGLYVHTDRGDGEIVQVGGKTLRVELSSGEKITIRKMSAFIITRENTSNKDIRTQLLKLTGDVPLDSPVEVLESQVTPQLLRRQEKERRIQEREEEKARREEERRLAREGRNARRAPVVEEPEVEEVEEPVRRGRRRPPEEDITDVVEKPARRGRRAQEVEVEEEEEVEAGLELDFTIVNDMLGIRLKNIGEEGAVDLAQANGFKFSPAYYAAFIPSAKKYLQLFQTWEEEGFSIPKANSDVCHAVYDRMVKGGKKAATDSLGFATGTQLKNFYREEFRPNPKETVLQPYPIIQDGLLYVALPMRGHPASAKAVTSVRVPGIKWMKFDASAELIRFAMTKAKASEVIKSLIDDGVNIRNLAEMRKAFRELRLVKKAED